MSYSQRLFLNSVLSSNVVKSLMIIHPPRHCHFQFLMGMANMIFALHVALCNALFFQTAVSHFTSLAHQLASAWSDSPLHHYSLHGTSAIWLFYGLLVTFLFLSRHFFTLHGHLEVFCKYPQLLYCFSLNAPFKTWIWDAWRSIVVVRCVSPKTPPMLGNKLAMGDTYL